MGRSIVITGGAGFIGLAAAEALLATGHRVTALDLSPPPAVFLDHPALAGLSFMKADLRDKDSFEAAVAQAGADTMLHLAAITPNAALIHDHAAEILTVNIAGTAAAMAAAKSSGIRRFFMTSSIAIYGTKGPWTTPTLRESGPLCPDSLYGLTRRAAEDAARLLAPVFGLSLTILRLGPVFGPWEHLGAARPNLSPHAQILALHRAGMTATLPHQMRADWLYARDAARAIAGLIDRTDHGDAEGDTVNIGAGRLSTPGEWAAASGLPAPQVADSAALNVTAAVALGRPPMDVTTLLTRLPDLAPISRPLTEAAQDFAAWRTQIAALSTPEVSP